MLLKDRKIIVTGGPTREWLDPVRFISNPSSGKMGIALADESYIRSPRTLFIHGPVNEELIRGKPYGMASAESTDDLLREVLNALEDGSLLIMAAAPSDYTPIERSYVKMKKGSGGITLRLKRTPDILMAVSESIKSGKHNGVIVVGFAAETVNIEEYALGKLKEKNLDMICLNDVSRNDAGFAVDTNRIIIFDRMGLRTELPVLSKKEASVRILDYIEEKIIITA